MSISMFELFHGAVLTKLARSDRPVTLRMIETRPGEAWSAYTLNDEVDLFIKHSTTPRQTNRGGVRGLSWQLVFGPNQLAEMSKAPHDVYVALVGAGQNARDTSGWCICLLDPEQVRDVLDLSVLSQQVVTVSCLPGRRLRVYKNRRVRFKIAQNRISEWDVPGS